VALVDLEAQDANDLPKIINIIFFQLFFNLNGLCTN